MGCAASKVEDLPAVALCRDRCKYLEEALCQAQAMADSHVAYLASLRTLGPVLHRFFHDIPAGTGPPQPPESDSHLQFPSDSESEYKEDHTDKQLGETPTPVSVHNQCSRKREEEAFKYLGGRLTSELPPPPPPPVSSTWDFLNLFDAYERESYLAPLYTCTTLVPEEAAHTSALAAAAADKINNEINVKHNTKNIDDDQERESRSPEKGKTTHMATSTATPPSVSVSPTVPEAAEAMRELHLLFDRASESGNQVLLSLQSHHLTISLDREYGFDDHEGLVMSSQNLSHTLKTLFLWEKKLYHEVKAEERLRVTHEKKSRMLKHLEHSKGTTTSAAESPKLNSLRSAVRDLLTKMKIAIQIVDRISITINKLRDEELWPQTIEFINRLLNMWKAMVECHRSQYQAMVEAKGLDGVAISVAISNAKLSGAHKAETAIQLKLELQNWNVCFSKWIVAQKGYVKALNGWLLRCLLHEPNVGDQELTADEGIGAPPVFVICNEWSQAMDRLSEKEVVEAIRGFWTSIHTLLMEDNNNNVEMVQQRMVSENKDIARKVKFLEEEEGKEQKILHKLMRGRGGKKNVGSSSLRAGEDESHGERVQQQSSSDLVWDLKQTLMAMEKFTANSLQAYNELHAHIELEQVSCRQSGISG